MVAMPYGRLVVFTDAFLVPYLADVVISQEGDFSDRSKKLILGGLQYACLRRDFWDLPPREIRDPARRVLVTTGGGDIDGLAGRLVAGLAEHCPPETEIELIWGPGFSGEPPPGVTLLERPRSLRDALLGADVVVCTGGQTMLEAAATGAPIVAVEAVPNQRFQISALRDAKGIFEANEHVAPVVAATMIDMEEVRQKCSRKARKAVDGRGALRIASELAALERR
jgi:spore coat polysaccharide biosynthesis predicted glycosyltransferase SpsG